MTIKSSGSAYLVHNARIINAYPGTILVFGTRDTSAGSQTWAAQSQASSLARAYMRHFGSSDTKQSFQTSVGGTSHGASKSTAPHANTAAGPLQLFASVFTNTTSQTLYFGDSTPASNATGLSTLDNWTLHDTVTVGALLTNGAAVSEIMKGSFAEAHFFSVALTATDIGNIIAGTVKPEEIAGWIDGWTFKDHQPSGTYTSITGTRTMTAVGTIETSTVAHPIARTTTDTTAPVLSLPTGASSGTTTATGTVTTDESNGTLYRLTSINATETSATIVASGVTQAVTAAGVQNITATGLTASTAYYHHYVHKDTATNTSNVVSSASFTTAAAGDVTAPTLSAQTASATSSTAASGTVSTNESGGSLYRYVSVNATETAATVKAAALFQAVTATGVQNFSVTGLTGGTSGYRVHLLHRDAAGNDSAVVSTAAFATPVSTGGTISMQLPLARNNRVLLRSQAVTVFVSQVASNAHVLTKSLTTSSEAIMPDFVDIDIVTGTDYRVIWKFADDPDGGKVEGMMIVRAL